MPSTAVDCVDRPPAKENVRRALDHSLTDNDAPSVLLDRAFAVEMPGQHGFARFLDLEEQGTAGSVLFKQHNPAIGTDAAHTNDLACDINDPVSR